MSPDACQLLWERARPLRPTEDIDALEVFSKAQGAADGPDDHVCQELVKLGYFSKGTHAYHLSPKGKEWVRNVPARKRIELAYLVFSFFREAEYECESPSATWWLSPKEKDDDGARFGVEWDELKGGYKTLCNHDLTKLYSLDPSYQLTASGRRAVENEVFLRQTIDPGSETDPVLQVHGDFNHVTGQQFTPNESVTVNQPDTSRGTVPNERHDTLEATNTISPPSAQPPSHGGALAQLDEPRQRNTKRKYQVFISSTYTDLRLHREAVSWAVLKLEHIPIGMECFSASSDRGWETIQHAIDDSDYYVLLVGARYGSVDKSTGISWTEREYQYALSKSIPVLVFMQNMDKASATHVETSPGFPEKLANFKATLENTHLCAQFDDDRHVASEVTQALVKEIGKHESTGRARPGWYRGPAAPPQAAERSTLPESPNAQLAIELQGATDANLVVTREELRLESELPNQPLAPTSATLRVLNWIRDNNARIELKFTIRNEGRVAAKNLVVDLTCLNCLDVMPGARGHLNNAPWLDKSSHVYVDGCEAKARRAVIRQRVKQVNVGASEVLVPIFLQLDVETSTTATIDCVIASETTLPLTRQFVARIDYSGRRSLSLKEADDLRRKKRFGLT